MERTDPPRDRREELTGGVERSPTRCPYCHDSVRAEDVERAVVCGQCLARHHAECWDGHCGACAATIALGRLDVASGPSSALYERSKRVVSIAWLVCFGLYIVLMLVGIMLTAARNELRPDALPLAMIPGILAGVFTVLLTFPMIALNSYDAIARRYREPDVSWLAIALALGGLVTGGMATFAYFVVWGRRPLTRDTKAITRKTGKV